MFLDRRSLLQSAAALLVPSSAAIPTLGRSNPEHQRAVDRYFQTFEAYYGKPFRPDDDSWDAHDRLDEEKVAQRVALRGATHELQCLVMASHGLGESDDAPVAALTLDVGDLTVVVAPHVDPEGDNHPLGWEALAFIPRTPAMRATLNAIPTFHPLEWDSDEDRKELGLKTDRNPLPPVDLSRMPAGEPVPLSAECKKGYHAGTTRIIRTWTPDDALACGRCLACQFDRHTFDTIGDRKSLECEFSVKDEDVEKVLYGATPTDVSNHLGNDVMVSTHAETHISEPGLIELMAMSRKEWDDGDYVHATAGNWVLLQGERGTRGKLVVAIRYRPGPIPLVLEWA